MKTQLYNIISVVTIVASFVPIVLVSIKKLWKESAFLLIACYWMLSGLVNILDKIPGISAEALRYTTIVYNMLDIPIVLGILFYTTSSKSIKKFTGVAAPLLLIVQFTIFLIKGWEYDSAKYILAAGLLFVMVAVVWEISLYMQKLHHTRHEKAMIFIHVSLLFAYGTFIIIYIFDYYIKTGVSTIDNFIIYYISSLVAITIASIGYLAKSSRKNFI